MSSVCVCQHFDFAHAITPDGRGECLVCGQNNRVIGSAIIACPKFEPQIHREAIKKAIEMLDQSDYVGWNKN